MAIRRVLLATGLAAFLLFAGGCRGKHSRTTVENEEEPADATPRLASAFKMNDPATAAQLVKGFYGVEGGAWRWTAGNFSVMFRTPLAAAQHGAAVTLAFTVPEVSIQKAGAMTLTASVGGAKLKSETYSKPGAYTFTADVPGDQLTKDSVTVDFSLDKFIPAGAVDARQLGVIATAVGLESK